MLAVGYKILELKLFLLLLGILVTLTLRDLQISIEFHCEESLMHLYTLPMRFEGIDASVAPKLRETIDSVIL